MLNAVFPERVTIDRLIRMNSERSVYVFVKMHKYFMSDNQRIREYGKYIDQSVLLMHW